MRHSTGNPSAEWVTRSIRVTRVPGLTPRSPATVVLAFTVRMHSVAVPSATPCWHERSRISHRISRSGGRPGKRPSARTIISQLGGRSSPCRMRMARMTWSSAPSPRRLRSVEFAVPLVWAITATRTTTAVPPHRLRDETLTWAPAEQSPEKLIYAKFQHSDCRPQPGAGPRFRDFRLAIAIPLIGCHQDKARRAVEGGRLQRFSPAKRRSDQRHVVCAFVERHGATHCVGLGAGPSIARSRSAPTKYCRVDYPNGRRDAHIGRLAWARWAVSPVGVAPDEECGGRKITGIRRRRRTRPGRPCTCRRDGP